MVSFFLLVVIKKDLTFNKPLNFISGVYNRIISLKEVEFKQKIQKKNRGAKI